MATLWELMRDCIPDDHARQVTSRFYLDEAMTSAHAPDQVVDLGCGRGTSAARFRRHNPEVRWVGVDIGDSPRHGSAPPAGTRSSTTTASGCPSAPAPSR